MLALDGDKLSYTWWDQMEDDTLPKMSSLLDSFPSPVLLLHTFTGFSWDRLPDQSRTRGPPSQGPLLESAAQERSVLPGPSEEEFQRSSAKPCRRGGVGGGLMRWGPGVPPLQLWAAGPLPSQFMSKKHMGSKHPFEIISFEICEIGVLTL